MPRSAPVSPSHMGMRIFCIYSIQLFIKILLYYYNADNSRESSPLQDFVLQSAPGSPGMSIEQRAADGGNKSTSKR